jgi:hypothetical protein
MNFSLQRGDGLEAPRGKPTEPDIEKESDAEKEDKVVDEAEEEELSRERCSSLPRFQVKCARGLANLCFKGPPGVRRRAGHARGKTSRLFYFTE